MTARVNAGEPLPLLLRRAARAGWGDLAGREWQGVRSTLAALAARLPDKSGAGLITAWDISQAAGLSERWTRRCLGVLEDIGVIIWNRGGIVRGAPQPSYIRVAKSKLVELIVGARRSHAQAEAAHTNHTRARLSAYAGKTFKKTKPWHKPRSVHAALSASPHPPKGGSYDATPTPIRKGIEKMAPQYPKIPPVEKLNPFKLIGECQHGFGERRQCPLCRADAMTDSQRADFEAALQAWNRYVACRTA